MKSALFLTLVLVSTSCLADQLIFNAGVGPQPGSGPSQTNATFGIDYEFYRYRRSDRQFLSLGASYTYLSTDAPNHARLHAVSIYPQVTLIAPDWRNYEPWFFVRALGPSWMSDNQFGYRTQSKHFAFQAQVGVGLRDKQSGWLVALSYKHFSNANLYDDNDGFDVTTVLNVGKAF